MSDEQEIRLGPEEIEALAQGLGLPQLIARLDELESQTIQLVAYMNRVDLEMQQLSGEPVVTARIRAGGGSKSGRIQIDHIQPTQVPDDIAVPSQIESKGRT